MSMENELHCHYGMLLGINSPWEVGEVELSRAAKQVRIRLDWQWGAEAECPECGRACSIYDSAPERRLRHLDTMQFETEIRARVARANCPEHGVRTMSVPWPAPAGRFTLMFERFAIEVLRASASVAQACQLLRISWSTAHQIMERAVGRRLDQREPEGWCAWGSMRRASNEASPPARP